MTNHELKVIRLSMNLTQTELANLLYVKKGTISRWERGLWPVPEDKVELLQIKHDNYQIRASKGYPPIQQAPFVGGISREKIQKAIDSMRKK